MNRPAPIKTSPVCPHCGNPITPGGYALVCNTRGRSTTVQLPNFCTNRQCRSDRDDAAIAKAIADGVIDP